jgi:hypothetical protein
VNIPEAHCSVEFHPGWPLHEERGADQGSVSQSLGDSDGTVFLRYGPSSALGPYIERWRARYGEGARLTADDRMVTRDGLEGRRMVLALPEEVMSRRDAPRRVTPAQTLACDGYTIRSVPVILGYAVPESTDPRLIEAAEAILASLSALR